MVGFGGAGYGCDTRLDVKASRTSADAGQSRAESNLRRPRD